MWRRGAENAAAEGQGSHNKTTEMEVSVQHPYAFNVSGPRNVPSINWRYLINSSWSVSNFLLLLLLVYILI